MKKLILSILCILAFSTQAMAFGPFGAAVPFNNYSATSSAAVYSAAYNVTGMNIKTLTVTGIAVAGHTPAALSGTVLVQCGPTSSGPWATCINNNYAQTAASTTANGSITWMDASPYIRASWSKTSGQVKAWLNWQ